MNADDMQIANQNYLNQEDYSKPKNKGDSYSQNGNHGIDHNSGGVIKDNAKVAEKIDENNHNQSQNTNNQVTVDINIQNNSNISEKEELKTENQKHIKFFIEEGNKKASIEAPYSAENLKMCFDFMRQRFDNSLRVEDIEKGSIRFILKGSEEGLKNIVESFKSGELAPLLKQRFNLELESVKLINSDSSENYPKNQSQKLLAFTIAGNVSQADIDILKAALIDTSDDDEEIKNEEKSRLAEKESRNMIGDRNSQISQNVIPGDNKIKIDDGSYLEEIRTQGTVAVRRISTVASSKNEGLNYVKKKFITKKEIQTWLVSRLAEYLQIEPHEIDIDQDFSNYGLDSAEAINQKC